MPLHQYLTAVRGYFKSKGGELIVGECPLYHSPFIAGITGYKPCGSVILNWLKAHSKRQVQYMAGHKYLSSTEKYAAQEVEDLQDALAKYHPFG